MRIKFQVFLKTEVIGFFSFFGNIKPDVVLNLKHQLTGLSWKEHLRSKT